VRKKYKLPGLHQVLLATNAAITYAMRLNIGEQYGLPWFRGKPATDVDNA
jgi:hypothetical protein